VRLPFPEDRLFSPFIPFSAKIVFSPIWSPLPSRLRLYSPDDSLNSNHLAPVIHASRRPCTMSFKAIPFFSFLSLGFPPCSSPRPPSRPSSTLFQKNRISALLPPPRRQHKPKMTSPPSFPSYPPPPGSTLYPSFPHFHPLPRSSNLQQVLRLGVV